VALGETGTGTGSEEKKENVSFSFSFSFFFLFLLSFSFFLLSLSFDGRFGTFGAGTLDPEELREEILKTKKLTSRPFGVDVVAPFVEDFHTYVEQYVDVCIETGVKAFITGIGFSPSVIEKCHKAGMVVGVVCGKISHVKKAVEEGADLVIVQGTEGGGHTGTLGLMAFLPQAVDAVGHKVPVVAAGGIFDGRGVAAALALGADGVWVGTRFLATEEANTVRGFKEKIVQAGIDNGTTISKAYTGKTCRVLANDYTREWEKSGVTALDFKNQGIHAITAGVHHLGGNLETEGVDPNREFMPW